jgi:hypothetical protein
MEPISEVRQRAYKRPEIKGQDPDPALPRAALGIWREMDFEPAMRIRGTARSGRLPITAAQAVRATSGRLQIAERPE